MRADPRGTKVADDVLRIWLHECDRVFADRLVNDEDRQWLKDAQGGLMNSMFSRSYDDVVTTERLVFGDFMIPSASFTLTACLLAPCWVCTSTGTSNVHTQSAPDIGALSGYRMLESRYLTTGITPLKICRDMSWEA